MLIFNHMKASNVDDKVVSNSASGVDSDIGIAPFVPGAGKKCFASCCCSAVDSYKHKHTYELPSQKRKILMIIDKIYLSLFTRVTYLKGDDANQDAKDEEDERDDEPNDAPH
jgi:hypothetical protein